VRRQRLAATAGLVGLALIAAACGGDDSDSAGDVTTTTAAPAASSSTTAAPSGGSTTSTTAAPQPKSIQEWESLWATQRAAIVKRIKDNKWGKSADGKTLTGPEGWTVDLTKCSPGWSDTEGLTDTSVKIGHSISLSGTYADYGNLGKAIQFLFNYQNANGGFPDSTGKTRKVDYVMKDDGYDPARAIPNVDEFLDSDKSFAIWTLGTPATLKTYDKINQRCVPQPMAMTAHVAWGDPVNHPWTTGAPQPTYSTEAILWGAFIEQHLSEFPTDRKIKVASLVQNNDFGKLYDASFKSVIADSPTLRDRVDYFNETIEAQAPTVSDPMTTMASKEPDIWITMLAGTQCTQIVNEIAQNGMKEKLKYAFMPQTCPGATFIAKDKLGGDGMAGDGWWILSPGLKDMRDTAFDSDPYVVWLKDEMRKQGIDPLSSSNLSGGINYGFPVWQSLLIAGQLDGGLTRANFQLALRAFDMTSPMLLPGMKLHMDGLKDAYPVEAGVFQTWDAAKQTWVSQGNVIDLDGKAKLCTWDQATASCK
jgi:branched-chain amino acid transport system substrate-binding protein